MKNRTTLLTLLTVCLMLWSCDTKTKTVDSCGDGFVDPGEECDGDALGGASCTSLGFYKAEGTLACDTQCRYDTTDCGAARCGDDIVHPYQEECEAENLGGQTCVSLGYERGNLVCDATCHFDRSVCEGAGLCGDNAIQDPEECDGNQLDGQTCLSLGYYAGTLACSESCQFELDSCHHRCGDGTVDTSYQEICDGLNLDGKTCLDLGYYGNGALACDSNCRMFDESGCEATGWCGDGMTQTSFGEVCDGNDLDGQTCESQSFVSGTLACSSGCQELDTSGCTMNYESPHIGTLIYVPAGTFQRDATATNLSLVSAFRMSKYEITRAQWTAVTGWADPSNPTYSSGTSDPVHQVSWYDAIAFCNKLSLLEGLVPVYAVSGVNFSTLTYSQIPTSDNATWNAATANWAANGYRLPTEMEWMWAAMGADTANPGLTNTTGHLKAFAGSTGTNAIGDHAWYSANSSSKTHPAGTKLPNELGLYDLSGNAFEWAWDWYAASYPTGTVTDTRGPASGTGRVIRGGGWSYDASYCPVASRFINNPFDRYHYIGFRVVRP